MDRSNLCGISNSTLLKIDIISTSLAITSVVACVLAISLLVYYKFYCSFNYRLVLYLLLSHLINSTNKVLQIPFLWLRNNVSAKGNVPIPCLFVALMKVYCTWTVALSTAIVIVEISSMIMCSYQLHNEERVLIMITFFLPIIATFIPLAAQSYGYSEYFTCGFKLNNCQSPTIEMYEDYVPITIVTCICIAAITMAIVHLVYTRLRLKFVGTNLEEEHLLNQHIGSKYQNALKQTLPFAVYPAISLVSMVVYYLRLVAHNEGTLDYIALFIMGSTGAFSSGTFFIHLYTLGRERRNKFKHQQRVFKSVATINEGQIFTPTGSMSGSYNTIFKPPTESEVEKSYMTKYT